MITVTALIYRENQDLLEGMKSVVASDVQDLDILVVDLCDTTASHALCAKAQELDARIRVASGTRKNLAEAYNAARSQVQGKYFVNLPPNIRFGKVMLKRLATLLDLNENLSFVYSDFEIIGPEGKKTKTLIEDIGDCSEGTDFGHVKMYRVAHVEEVGGYDESLNRAEEYDLRLKLSDKYRFGHIPEPLYSCLETGSGGKVSVGSSDLFFPGEGEYGGFTYLFYGRDYEQEVERVFKNMLKRRGVYITNKRQVVEYEPGEVFTPLVSVVIPCRNRGAFIGRTIESALDQTFQDYEIIVVDNASTDDTVKVAKRYEGPKVRVIETGCDGTISFALNTGVNASKAKYISQLDSDDTYDRRTIERMLDHLESNPTEGLAISYYDLIDIDDNVLEKFGIIKHLEYDRNNILRVNGAGALRFWRRKVILEFGGFDEGEFANYGEDYDLVLKVGEKYRVGRVNHVCYHYRRHSDNTDAVRDPFLNIRLKTSARKYAYERRKKINAGCSCRG